MRAKTNARVGRSIDVQRLASAVRRPGIDTRCWVSLAVALEDSFVDADHGVFVNVRLMPTEEEYTARVSAVYAGSSFGLYRKISADDELVILIPSGEAAEGAVVISQLHSAADLPPQAAIDNPEEFVLVVQPEKDMRISLSGGGTLRVNVGDDNSVVMTDDLIELGSEGAGDKASLDSKVQTELKKIRDDVNSLKNTYNAHSVTVTVPALGLLDSVGGAVTGTAIGTSTAPNDAAPIQTIDSTNSERVTIDK